MADEIQNQNVIRVWWDDNEAGWVAAIGPLDGRELKTVGHSTVWTALGMLREQIECVKWPFDPTWLPKRAE